MADDDLQLALYLCYELHYGGLDGVDGDLEWDPRLLAVRRRLERRWEADLRTAVPQIPEVALADVVPTMGAFVGGRSVSEHLRARGTAAEVRDLLVHKSAYQLKEADPHTWGIPRLRGRAKRCLAEIQAGEYGVEHGDHEMHSELFAQAMVGMGLDARPNAYLDDLPSTSLAVSNLVSMFGLQRRMRGALAGHLALFEMTSVESMRSYVAGLERLAIPPNVRRFFEVHVLADEVHEVVALAMLEALLADEPELRGDVEFGIGAALIVERDFAAHLLQDWERAETSTTALR